MTNYSTNLKPWGATGTEYPDGYSYLEGEQPVDDWDNNFNHNVVLDIQHLISLTNERLDSGKGTSYPASAEDGYIYWRPDTQRAAVYDDTFGDWRELPYKSEVDAKLSTGGGTLTGNLDLETNNILVDHAGGDGSEIHVANGNGGFGFFRTELDGSVNQPYAHFVRFEDPAGNDVSWGADWSGDMGFQVWEWGDMNTLFAAKRNGNVVVPNGEIIVGGNNVVMHEGNDGPGSGFDADTVDGLHADELGMNIEEDGTVSVSGATAVDFTGHLNVINDGDGTVTIDPTHNHDGRYARLYDGVQAPVYASTGDVPSSISKGELVYIDGDGLYVEDGS